MSQLVAHDLAFAHGPAVVLDGVDVTVAPGMRIGVVGPNGVGKSTLLRLLAGELTPDRGSVVAVPADTTVGHLTQELHIGTTVDGRPETVADVVARRTGIADAQRALDVATAALAEGIDVDGRPAADAYDQALTRWLRLGGADAEHRLGATLDRVGLGAARATQDAASLSGGERARVNLASVLLAGFDVLALDEPTNDLDLDGLALLEDFLRTAGTAFVLVSHDRRFLERVVTSVLELDEHSRTARRFDGGWQAYLDERANNRRLAEEAYADYTTKRGALAARAQQQREWAQQGQARVRRSGETDKYIRHFKTVQTEHLAGKAKATEKAIERLDVVDKPWEGWELRLSFASATRSGADAVRCRQLVVARDRFRLGPIDLDIGYGERVALTGANGAGKTTLLDVVLGRIEPTAGTATLGPSVVAGTLDQRRSRFSSGRALLDAFVDELAAHGHAIDRTDARSQLAKLGLGTDHVARPTAALSPGERTRAALAAFALAGVNLLVLDEPTNHLDLPAIEQLESALDDFLGTVVLVTHDRAMLERVTVTRRVQLDAGTIVVDEPTG